MALRSPRRDSAVDPPSAFHPEDIRPNASKASARARVLVADPQPLTRLGIRRALEEHGFEVCADVADAQAAVEVAQREHPDVCLIDLGAPGDAVAAIERLAVDLPDSPVLVLTASCEDLGLLDGLCAGASGYVAKDADPEHLADAIRSALRGEVSLSRPLLAVLVAAVREHRERSRRSDSTAVRLTSREREILELLQRGLRTTEIAKRLFIEQVTVRSHICSIVRKLGVPDRQEAIRLLDEADGSPGNR